MDATQAFLISRLLWALLALAGVIAGVTFGVWRISAIIKVGKEDLGPPGSRGQGVNKEREQHIKRLGLFLAAFLLPTGLLYFALSWLGRYFLALWCWRVLSFLGMLTALVVGGLAALIGRRWRNAFWGLLGALLPGIFFFLSLSWEPRAVGGPSTNAPVAAPSSLHLSSAADISFWGAAVLTILALGTLVFIGFFLEAVRRGDLLQIESHWGGLGGGIGGWRFSASMTYLMMAAVLGTLFVVALGQQSKIDSSERRDEKNPSVSKQGSAVHPLPDQSASAPPEKTPAEEKPPISKKPQ
jgi:hypothetical protein